MTARQDSPADGRDPEVTAGTVDLRAWAHGHGTVYQSAESMIVFSGGIDLSRHDHFHSPGEESDRTSAPAATEECPYPGLRPFGKDEAAWFFGREALVSRLMTQLELSVRDRVPLAVVAPSGAGKSSLLRAGLLPELAKGQLPGSQRWPQLLLTPTTDPLAILASGFAQLTGVGETRIREVMESGPDRLGRLLRDRLELASDARIVLVVDQLEELFTLCEDESERRRFVSVIAALTGADHPVALAVLGIRADAYGSCVAFPYLRDALVDRQVILGPMADDEVRRAVMRPAALARVRLAPELVDVVLSDLRGSARRTARYGGDGAYEAGRLPLLAHALRATWLERRSDTLTVGSYRDTGGIDGAVAATAEEEFRKLSASDREAARLMFLGLVRIGDTGEVTRRRRTRGDLLLTAAEPSAVPGLVERFTRARLLTQGVERAEGTVEVTHEALLWAWPRLRDWTRDEAGRSGVPVRQELEEAAVAWERGGRKDTTALYRGARLELARAWAADRGHGALPPLMADFLGASQRYERRVRLVRRGAMAAITALAVLASGLAVFAFDRNRDAVEQRDNAIFHRVAAEADRQRGTDVALAAQLDLIAYRMRPTAALRTQLMEDAGSAQATALPKRFGNLYSAEFGPGDRLTTSAEGELRFWDVSDPVRPESLPPAPVSEVGDGTLPFAYGARGGLLAVGSADGTFKVLDTADARHPVALSAAVRASRGSGVAGLAFSPDSRTLALLTAARGTAQAGTVQLWSVADPRMPRLLGTVLTVERQAVRSIAFSPDGATLAVGGGTAAGSSRSVLLRLWDVSDPARPTELGQGLGGHNGIVNKVAFSPRGGVLASAGSDRRVLLWDVSRPGRPRLANTLFLAAEASALAFGPDGRLLATGDNSGAVDLWNAEVPGQTRTIVPTLRGHTSNITTLSFASSGRTLVSGGGEGKVLVWRLPSTMAVMEGGQAAAAVAVSDDGRLLAVASGARVTLWDISDPARLTRRGVLPAFRTSAEAVAFGPGGSGGRLLATGDAGGAVRLWDVSAPARPAEAGEAPSGGGRPVGRLAFDDQGHTLVAAALDLRETWAGGLRAWDVSAPDRPVPLGDELRGQRLSIRGMAGAPRDGLIYTGDVFGTLRVWRTREGTAPVRVGEKAANQVIAALAVSPDGRLIATGSGQSRVGLWDVTRPQSPTAVGKPLLTGGSVYSVGFSPEGGLLAGGDALGEVRLWDVSDPARARAHGLPVTGHRGMVGALTFAPRDGLLITGGADGTVRLWQTDPDRARALLCAATRGAMNADVWKEHVSPDLPYAPPCGAG
ncbi:WD40 repeat domain-containing protein [Streptomyces sp. NPDC095613]|uniref:WD40 repeat domain-containing protein n=1 Tax=Streptomyces sp. NPDC095613 TaxID=3155540 RepID=UPI0033344A3E